MAWVFGNDGIAALWPNMVLSVGMAKCRGRNSNDTNTVGEVADE